MEWLTTALECAHSQHSRNRKHFASLSQLSLYVCNADAVASIMSGILSNLPFSKKEQRSMPPIDPADDVIPVHLFDDMSAARGIVMVWTWKFHDVLDPHKLHDALSQLFQMDGWKKFSGRFRYRVSTHRATPWLSLLSPPC